MEQTFDVKGMHCASCAANIQKKIGKLDGVQTCEVNYGTETAKILYDPKKIDTSDMNHAVDKLGYELHPQGMHTMPDGTSMSADEHAAHTGVGQSQESKLQEIASMRQKVIAAAPMIIISFLYMIRDISANQ